ncbi:MAG: hypothetical protein ABR543_16750 [Gemmatimonadaceae bacterium]
MSSRARASAPPPFYEARCSPEPERRLLLISYAFPPEPSVGSLRWEKMSRFASERGWGLDVITVDPADIPAPDYRRLKELPPGVRLYGVPAPRLAFKTLERSALALVRSFRGNSRSLATATEKPAGAATADLRPASLVRDGIRWTIGRPRDYRRAYHALSNYAFYGRWARDAAELALSVIESGVHQAVVTSAPPHMAHEAGRRVSHATGLPFVMDMRDPWRLVEVVSEDVASPVWLWLATRYEQKAVRQASLIVANTEPCRQAMARTYPESAGKIIAVMNGYDDEPLPPARHSGRFTIAYAGGLYWGRDPRPLFAATARVVRDLGLTPEQLGLDIIGHVEGEGGVSLSEIARAEGVTDYVRAGPPRPRKEALEFLAQATMLVNFDVAENNLVIAAKVFEYMRFEAWLLLLTRPGSAPDLLLRDSGADVVRPDDVDGIETVLRKRYEMHRRGLRPTPIARNGRFSRRHQAGILLDAIEKITGEPDRHSVAPELEAARRL